MIYYYRQKSIILFVHFGDGSPAIFFFLAFYSFYLKVIFFRWFRHEFFLHNFRQFRFYPSFWFDAFFLEFTLFLFLFWILILQIPLDNLLNVLFSLLCVIAAHYHDHNWPKFFIFVENRTVGRHKLVLFTVSTHIKVRYVGVLYCSIS